MENNQKQYWQGLEELNKDPEFLKHAENEFYDELPLGQLLDQSDNGTSRRDFFKKMGVGIGSAAFLAACTKTPVKRAVPYVNKAEEVTPGVANWYASACAGCTASCSIIIKTREGRPIKIEGNNLSELSQGGVCAVGQASLLNLYDDARLRNPIANKHDIFIWDEIDQQIINDINELKDSGSIAIVTPTIVSPATKQIIDDFVKMFKAKHVMYDAVSYSGIISANEKSFKKAVIPNYKLDQAELIVSFSADFLGTWISPVRFTRQYVSKRNNKELSTKNNMSRLIQFEANFSLTGTNADTRYPVKPSEENLSLFNLYNELLKLSGRKTYDGLPQLSKSTGKINLETAIRNTANELWSKRGGRSVVLCGSNDTNAQLITNAINSLLGNYGKTIDLDNYSNQKQGSDSQMMDLAKNIFSGNIKGVIFYNVNPVYDFPNFPPAEKISQLKFSIAISERFDETASLTKYVCPSTHFLESWDLLEPTKGYFHIMQPAVRPIFNSRSGQDSLLKWMGQKNTYYDYIKNHFNTKLAKVNISWEKAVHDGIIKINPEKSNDYKFNDNLNNIKNNLKPANPGTDLLIYESIQMRDGKHSNNPWLQELPDPISKVTWDNYAGVSPQYAKAEGWKQGDIINIQIGTYPVKLPVVIQPGIAYGTIVAALGYGHKNIGKVGNNIGQNLFPVVLTSNNTLIYNRWVTAKATGESYKIAQTQTYHSISDPFFKEPRPIVMETTLDKYKVNKKSGNESHHKLITLWEDRPERVGSEYSWGMSIDLNSCTGCSACVVSCNAENNVAVVGKEQILMRRDMQWIRIDRYYSGDPTNPSENPEVTHQPMMCQHCDNAPCETVCPVLATTHSIDGLNQQAYNRCVGTRYCANNCPYKVRRFNWFEFANNNKYDYHMNNPVGKLTLNPDVVVRSRGVMEKCSMCIQRIQEAKLNAKMKGIKLADGDIKMACEQSCPGNAIVFGNLKDPNSRISKLFKNERKYHVIEEFKTLPSVAYLTKIRNNKG